MQRRRREQRSRDHQRGDQSRCMLVYYGMDNLTHSLFATLARMPAARAGRGTTIALIVASNAPDVDILTTAGGGEVFEWHRGMSHGPIGIVGLGVITAGLCGLARPYDQRSPNKDGGSHQQTRRSACWSRRSSVRCRTS